MKQVLRSAMFGLAALALAGCPGNNTTTNPAPGATKLQAGGSTFVGPMMEEWAKLYEKQKGIKISYTLGGSGQGISNMSSKQYDFGCTDAYMTNKELEEAKGGEVLHVPLVMGAIVPAYNLKDVPQLKLTGPVLADVYLGKVTKWNDKAIADLNPGVALPDLKIVPVRRSDPSGSTFIFTTYLSQVSDEWKTTVGKNTEVKWPAAAGGGAKGTGALAKLVESTPGAIGYMEVRFAQEKKLPFASVRNKKGKDIPGDRTEAVTAAAQASLPAVPDDLRFVITDADGDDSYPICGVVWAVLYAAQPPDKVQPLKDFLAWVITDGQQAAPGLGYSRLPAELVPKVEQKLAKITPAS